jgi:hypothetical protein
MIPDPLQLKHRWRPPWDPGTAGFPPGLALALEFGHFGWRESGCPRRGCRDSLLECDAPPHHYPEIPLYSAGDNFGLITVESTNMGLPGTAGILPAGRFPRELPSDMSDRMKTSSPPI